MRLGEPGGFARWARVRQRELQARQRRELLRPSWGQRPSSGLQPSWRERQELLRPWRALRQAWRLQRASWQQQERQPSWREQRPSSRQGDEPLWRRGKRASLSQGEKRKRPPAHSHRSQKMECRLLLVNKKPFVTKRTSSC